MTNQEPLQNLDELRTFVAIAEAGSLTGAAASLGLKPNAVSRRLSALEERLGRRLINRTTRRLSVTEEGLRLQERCRRIFDELREAERELLGLSDVGGTVRIALHADILNPALLLGVQKFLNDRPRLNVHFRIVSRFADPIREGLDLATHIGKPAASSLVGIHLGSLVWVLAATPAYLKRHGRPQSPEDLRRHQCLRLFREAPETRWHLGRKSERSRYFEVGGRFEANDGAALQTALYSGLGIGIRLLPEIEAASRAGTLERVLPEWEWASTPAYAMLPQGRSKVPAVREFIDLLKTTVAQLK